MLIRPVTESDLDAVAALARRAGVGMTSLAGDRAGLAKKIALSVASFACETGPVAGEGERLYFFVAEDPRSGQLVGTTAIKSGIGLGEPFYNYRLGTHVHSSRELGIYKQIPTLYLSNDYTGCMEIGSLFLEPAYRGGGAAHGRLLSACRWLFMAAHLQRFPEKVIAEMRGVSDAEGRSPFWDALGSHFFSMDFPRADSLSAMNKTFIAELMPRNPVYVPLLPEAAQAVIGEVHEQTRAALKLLLAEGFRYEGFIDIFDAGPVVEARVRDVRSVRDSRVVSARVGRPQATAPRCLLGNERWASFRACIAPAGSEGDELVIDAATAAALGVADGDAVRAMELA